ncbi:MAG TPA: DNA replication and repair protein RecF [Thermoanaerobaculia bacterium]|nr:DNA replication and repair protein RecF [Thermoanaerobaculia bacterium]
MILARITTQNFRNLAEADTPLHSGANILVGRNGQGKTNLLEAIYFLATTKSFRTNRIASVFRFGAASVFVSGALQREGIERTLSVGVEGGRTSRPPTGGGRDVRPPHRVLMINGEKVTLPAYLNAMSVFAYSSARLDVIRGAPEERRRFLDRGIASVNPAYLEQLTRYTRVLRQRNALLAGIATHRESPSSLDAWDEELREAAAIVHRARAAYAADLSSAFAEIVRRHGYHVANVVMRYGPSELVQNRRDEIRARMTLAGPQRDAIDFFAGERAAAEVLSGGEQKMIVLFLKFAKLELFRRRHDDAPLFLLDDVDAELDLEILRDLLTKLPAKTQVFTTSAKEVFLEALQAGPHRRLTIEGGRVTGVRDFA